MKVLLVQPHIKPPPWFAGSTPTQSLEGRALSERERRLSFIMVEFNRRAEPLALEMVAACVPERHAMRIVDLRLEPEDGLEHELAAFRPDVVGLTCMFTCSTNVTLETARRIRASAPGVFLIVGGHAPSLAPEHFDDPAVDAIALGEGELILPPLLERLETGQDWRDLPGLAYRADGVLHCTTEQPLLVDDLNALPTMARHLVARYADQYRNLQRQVGLVSTSRGCPFRCTFCTVQQMYRGHYRCLSAERTVEEIVRAPGDFLVFPDDNFLVNVPRARRIVELLLARGIRRDYFWQARTDGIARHPELIKLWKQAGLSDVFLGLESPEDARLARLKKQMTGDVNQKAIEVLNDLDITIWGSFIVDPAFDEDDFAHLRRYVRQSGITYPVFAVLTPLPGTELWDQCHNQLTTHNLDFFDTAHAVLPTKLPLARFYQLYFELFQTTSFLA